MQIPTRNMPEDVYSVSSTETDFHGSLWFKWLNSGFSTLSAPLEIVGNCFKAPENPTRDTACAAHLLPHCKVSAGNLEVCGAC